MPTLSVPRSHVVLGLAFLMLSIRTTPAQEQSASKLPDGVVAAWDLADAFRESTNTRERVCINGLWNFQPADAELSPAEVPTNDWGWFKVPGCWPGITDYMQKDCQTVFEHPSWDDVRLRQITSAWYQREIAVPSAWTQRRIILRAETVNSLAVVFVDGKQAGEIRYPAGEVDVTAMCRPGQRHRLSIHVTALPLKGVMLSYSDTASAKNVRGSVARRGLCGDVFLESRPIGPRIRKTQVVTSVRKRTLEVATQFDELAPETDYRLQAKVSQGNDLVLEFSSTTFQGRDVADGRLQLSEAWKPAKLWDIHTPQHTFDIQLTLSDANGRVLDTSYVERFGFREFWIDGRDFYLNGSRIFLSSVPVDNAQVGAAWANYEAAKESLLRLKRFGINFVYTHNYGCEPGSHLSFEEILRAADDVGMLVALSQPHFGHYEWDGPNADSENGYADHAAFYVDVAHHHPSVVAYSTSHNATGYGEDMNPNMIDGIQAPRGQWSERNVRRAMRAESIITRLDPSRIVYHHASGNLGSLHAINFYANFAPVQEMSDWFEHWSKHGVKPVFTNEYAVPMTWDWTMYRGWFEGKREFGSAQVPWEFCLAEWNAEFFGDRAYQISELEKANLRWEAERFRSGRLWHRWDYPNAVGSNRFSERFPIFARYISENWPAFRTWELSANSPWDHGHHWTLREGVDRGREELAVDWRRLQQPGFSPDYIAERYERIDLAYGRDDWEPTIAGKALIDNNGPLLAYIAGKPDGFTSKDHNFFPGETVEKQLIVINNSRETTHGHCTWVLELTSPVTGERQFTVETGKQARLPLRFELPDELEPGNYRLRASVHFDTGEAFEDQFSIDVIARAEAPKLNAKIAVFDPVGETSRFLEKLAIEYVKVDADADLSTHELLIVGKGALTLSNRAPDVRRVVDGLKVLVFEQTPEVLEQRFGFRVATRGMRSVFPRVPDHPVLEGVGKDQLRDWRGASTLVPPQLDYELSSQFNESPTVRWCGIPVTRLWRCGNRGNVATCLIEKPPRGDFLPIVDAGYSLQYSPLMEYREGNGMVLFCQLDVTGRTESDPVAQNLVSNALGYASNWQSLPRRSITHVGDAAVRRHLESAGIVFDRFDPEKRSVDQVLLVSRGGGRALSDHSDQIATWLEAGGYLLAVGLDETEANSFLPSAVSTKEQEHIATYFEPFEYGSLIAGVSPADVHNASPRRIRLISGDSAIGNGVLGQLDGVNVVFCQFSPDEVGYSEGNGEIPKAHNLKRTYRRASFQLTRLLANMGVSGTTPTLERFSSPLTESIENLSKGRWREGLYLDAPEEWDDPYRFFRW